MINDHDIDVFQELHTPRNCYDETEDIKAKC